MTHAAEGRSDVLLRRPPNFFIVGAPKCATSSLHSLLTQHPNVFMCSPKEPHYFSTDLPGLGDIADARGYDALFANAPSDACLGEASAFYLMSRDAPAAIHATCPNAKIIISLRNPSQAVWSWYHQLRDGFREDQTSFEDAWKLQEVRAKGQELPSYCPEARQLQYKEVYSYADQVARYLDVFGSDQVLILRFEDIAQKPDAVVDNILKFLDLAPFPTAVEIPRTNTRRAARFPGLTQLIAAPPPLLRPFVAPVKRIMNAMGVQPSVFMMKFLSRKDAKAVKPAARDPDFQSDLDRAFADDIGKLEAVTGFDFSAWRTAV